MGKLNNVVRLALKAKELVAKNDDKVKNALDKAAGAVDSRTKGKYSEKIGGVVAKAKEAVDKLPDQPRQADPAAPPTPPPPPAPPGEPGQGPGETGQ